MNLIRPVILRGDYVLNGASGGLGRQAMAVSEQCVAVVEFHFNSGPASARGGEVHFQPGVAESRRFAELMWDGIASTGLPAHGTTPVQPALERSAFIVQYSMPTILLEPLFLSNVEQAGWLHTPDRFEALAASIVKAILAFVGPAATIGLSPGHAYKTSAPNDTGAPCLHGDNEKRHVLEMVERVQALLVN